MRMAIAPIFIPHAGCPHRCLFCDQKRSTGRGVVPDGAAVAAQLDAMLPVQGAGEIAFYGGTFTLLPQRQQDDLLTVAGRFIDAGRAAAIRISTRPDALGEAQLHRLRLAGVATIEIGCQSFSDPVLRRARRGHTAATAQDAVARCRAAGFRVGIQLMPGLPGANAESDRASLHCALALSPDFLRIYPTVVIAGTGLAGQWRAGRYEPLSLDAAVDLCADLLAACRQQGVPVIRIGLQPDPALEKNLLAGPFHPAFGQLVRARLWRRVLLWATEQEEACLAVHPDDFSDVIGHRGENRRWLRQVRSRFTLETDNRVSRNGLRINDRYLAHAAIPLPGVTCG